jgi:hypothetical protein
MPGLNCILHLDNLAPHLTDAYSLILGRKGWSQGHP